MAKIPGLFQGLGAQRILLVSDPGLEKLGIVERVASQFEGGRGSSLAGVFTETAPEAESGCVDDAVRYAREIRADAILAVGGGSVLDSAKLAKLALHRGVDSVNELLDEAVSMKSWPAVQHMGIHHIAVPTTAGTGAEVTTGAVIYNRARGMKHLLLSDYLEADIAVLDADLTTGLPPMLTAATGMDALTHAVETLAHPNANLFALAHASTSARVILKHLPRAVADGDDLTARQTMLDASAMACNAVVADFGAAPVHNFSHAIGAVCHIHHGEANAVLLPLVLEDFIEFYLPVADRLADAFQLPTGDPESTIKNCAAKIRGLLEETGHPLDFARHALDVARLPDIAEAVAQDPLSAFCPLEPGLIETVLRRACGWR